MRRRLWMLLMAASVFPAAYAQEEEGLLKEVIRIYPSATAVTNIAVLPADVQSGIADILHQRMGSIAGALTFSSGEVLHFKNIIGDKSQPDSSWIVPMYDLRFQLQDTTSGIQQYELELRVDRKGRLIYINWPQTGYSDPASLAPWEDVLRYAVHFAKLSKFYTPHYRVQLRYNPELGKMIWIFQFPVKDLSNVMLLRTLEVDWQKPKLLKQYMDHYY